MKLIIQYYIPIKSIHQFIYGLSHTSHRIHTQILLLQYNEMEMALVIFFVIKRENKRH